MDSTDTPVVGRYRGVTEMQGKVVAIDFETHYDSKAKYSLRSMTPHQYVNDPRFDAYLVAIVSDKGEKFCGRPELFHWGSLEGATLVAHNAAFDGMVLKRLTELSKIDSFKHELICTADMCAYLNRPRNLKDASKVLLGREMSKVVRDNMDGRPFESLNAQEVEDLLKYADTDAVNCLDLYLQYGGQFPQIERDISRSNREACWKGIAVDLPKVEAGLRTLKQVKWEAEQKLPWVEDGRAAGSTQALAAHAKSLGLPVPKSFKKDDPGMMEWIAQYAGDNPFIKARLDLASVNPHIARLESLKAIAETDGVGRFAQVYHGCHTGRVSASAGGKESSTSAKYNILNLPRSPVFGVDMRAMLKPRDGYVFAIYDYSQVEARIVEWLAGNESFLEIVRTEGNIYQAAAKAMGWFPMDGKNLKKNDPALYQLSKACLAPETLVLTETGYKRIVDITVTERVWDGQAWVTHEGVACNGYRTEDELSYINGERFTGDHGIYTGASSKLRADVLSPRDEASAMDWRQAAGPLRGWDDLRQLARAVTVSLAKEFGAAFKMQMSRVWCSLLSICLQRKKGCNNEVHGLCAEKSTGDLREESVGAGPGRAGSGTQG